MHGRKRVALLAAFCIGLLAATAGGPVHAKVFASQNQALAEAFPDATRVDRKTMILRKAQVEAIESRTGAKVEEKIVVLHVAYRDDELLGYAHIDVHTVRTQPEAFLVVLTPAGRVRTVRILAFHEPLDYLPTDRWYDQFEDKGEGGWFARRARCPRRGRRHPIGPCGGGWCAADARVLRSSAPAG